MTKLAVIVAGLVVVAAASVDGRIQHHSDLAGAWKMTMNFAQQASAGLELKVDGKKVSGQFVSGFAGGSVPLEGEFADGKLTFAISTTGGPHPGIQVDFYGTLKADGTLEGKLAGIGEGETAWSAVRIK